MVSTTFLSQFKINSGESTNIDISKLSKQLLRKSVDKYVPFIHADVSCFVCFRLSGYSPGFPKYLATQSLKHQIFFKILSMLRLFIQMLSPANTDMLTVLPEVQTLLDIRKTKKNCRHLTHTRIFWKSILSIFITCECIVQTYIIIDQNMMHWQLFALRGQIVSVYQLVFYLSS